MEAKRDLDFYLKEISNLEENNMFINMVQKKITGGAITYEEIDELKKYPQVKGIEISGLKQDTFEYFIENYGRQFEVIKFWKCPRVADFSRLELLTDIKYISFYWNQKATHLWDLSKNKNLKVLIINDFRKMSSLEEIPLAPELEVLEFGDVMVDKFIVNSLKPLAKAPKLRFLEFSPKKVLDNDVAPLTKIANLEKLEFPGNLFTTEQIAMLTARLKNVESSVLCAYVINERPFDFGGKILNTYIVGKGKPSLNSEIDRARIEKYKKQFEELVKKYESEELSI